MEQYYYPETIKNVSIALLDMFNDMVVKKYDTSGNTIKTQNVPLTFGPVDKIGRDRVENHYYDTSGTGRDTQVYESGQRYYPLLPRMALVLQDISYDPNRAYGVNEWRTWFTETLEISGTSDIDSVLRDYQPTPYTIGYTLDIRSDSLDYFAQIMENILPYFNPKLMMRVKEFSFLNVERDLPVSILSISPEMTDELDENGTKYTNAAIAIQVEAFMYRPFEYSKVIKYINSKYLIATDAGTVTSATTSAGLVSASKYDTSGVSTSGGVLDTSAIPPSGTYNISGTLSGDIPETYYYFTSADPYDN